MRRTVSASRTAFGGVVMRESEAVFAVSRVRIALGALALGGGLTLLALFAAPQSASAADEPQSGGILGALGGVVTSVTQPVVAIVDPVVETVVTPVLAPVVNHVVEPVVAPVVTPVVDEVVQPVAGVVDAVVETAVHAVTPVTAAVPALKPVVNAIPKVTTTVEQLGGPKPVGTILSPIVAGVDGTIRELPIVGSVVSGVLGTAPIGGVIAPVVDVVDGTVGGAVGGVVEGVVGGGAVTHPPIGTGPVAGGILPGGSISTDGALTAFPLGSDPALSAAEALRALGLGWAHTAVSMSASEYAAWAQATGGESASLLASAPESPGVPTPPGPGETPGKHALPPSGSSPGSSAGSNAHAASAASDLSPRSPDFTLQGALVPRAGNEVLPSSPTFDTDSSPD